MSVKITGVNEIIAALAKKEADIRKAGLKANTAGAKIVAAELEKTVPRSGITESKLPFLKDTVSISNNRTDRYTMQSYVAVGFPKSTSYRVHFVEFGTIKQSPYGFMTKTVQTTAKDVQKAMIAEVKKVLR